jgi:ketosteroid isomerase-like protein
MSADTHVLEQFFDAVNRNDVQAIGKDFDPEIVRVEPAGFPTSGTYRGKAEVQAQIASGRGTWAEGTCEPERYIVNGDRVVVYLHVRVRLKDASEWIDARFADGFVLRDGRIVQHLSFAERRDALEWAGLERDDVM